MKYEKKHYILDKDKNVVEAELLEWAMFFENFENRIVAQTEYPDFKVSTVFIGLDHNMGIGEPLLFETMIFGGIHDEYTERYSTWRQAEEGHKKAVQIAQMALGLQTN